MASPSSPEKAQLKNYLLFQQHLKSLESNQQKLDKLTELRQVTQQANASAAIDELHRKEQHNLKQTLAKEYQAQQFEARARHLSERRTETEREQQRLAHLKAAEAAELARRQQAKADLRRDQEATLRLRKLQAESQRQQELQLKAQERAEADRLASRRPFQYPSLTLDPLPTYTPPKARVNIETWIDKHVVNQNKIETQRARMEQQARAEVFQNLRNTLLAQINEKELKRQHERLTRVREQDTVNKSIELNKQLQRDQLEQKRIRQTVYKNQLLSQMNVSQQARSNPRIQSSSPFARLTNSFSQV